MDTFVRRLLRRGLPLAIGLGFLGWLFAEAYLFMVAGAGGVIEGSPTMLRLRAIVCTTIIGVLVYLPMELLALRADRVKKGSP